MAKAKPKSEAELGGFRGFGSQALPFLLALRENNDRTWFAENKVTYVEECEAPFRELVLAVGRVLEAQGSPMAPQAKNPAYRIYRDVRFSKDKTPYKTNVGIHFRHELGKDVHAPGFYVHIEPGNCFLGAGIWHPEAPVLNGIREFITDNPNAWKQATQAAAFKKDWALIGDTLVRPPRGIDPNHELLVDLKRKDFIACMNFDESLLSAPGFLKFVMSNYKRASALVSYLCMAVDVPY